MTNFAFKNKQFAVSVIIYVGTAIGLSLCCFDVFASKDTLEQLKGLVEMAEGANKTVAYVAGGTALSIGTIYSLAKQNIMTFLGSVFLALAAYKGTALVTAGCLI